MISKNEKLHLSFNGPFITDFSFHSGELLQYGYYKFREQLLEALLKGTSEDWRCPILRERLPRNHQSLLPHILVERHMEGEDLNKQLFNYDLPAFFGIDIENKEIIPNKGDYKITYTVNSITIRFTEFGCGSCIIDGTLTPSEDTCFDSLRIAGELLADKIKIFERMIKETGAVLRHHANQDFMSEATILHPTQSLVDDMVMRKSLPDYYKFVNTPRIFRIPCKTAQDFKEKRKVARSLLITTAEDYTDDISLNTNMVAYLGSGSSVCIYDEAKTENVDATVLNRIHPVMNLFYFLTESLTNNLFLLNNLTNLTANKLIEDIITPNNLEKRTNEILEYKALIDYFIARYKSYDNYLFPQGLKAWRQLESLWEVEDRQNALTDQLQESHQIYDRLRDRINNSYNRKITIFLAFFTLLSMLSVIVDTVDFTQEDTLVMPSAIRLATLATMASAFIIMALLIARRKK